jgi:hypothetical protein
MELGRIPPLPRQDPTFAAAGIANTASFAMRAGGRNTLYTLFAIEAYGYDAAELGGVFAAMAACDLFLGAKESRVGLVE